MTKPTPPAQEAKSWPPRAYVLDVDLEIGIKAMEQTEGKDGLVCFDLAEHNKHPEELQHTYISMEEHQAIISDLERKVRAARAAAWEEAAKEVDLWLDLLEADHNDIIAKNQYVDPQEAGREYRNKVNLLSSVRRCLLLNANAAKEK